LTEHFVYLKLANRIKDEANRGLLEHIAADELRHSRVWQSYTKVEPKPNWGMVRGFVFIARIFGLTFGLKLLERAENNAQISYSEIAKYIPSAEDIIADEKNHEFKLLGMINEEKLEYIGSIVLGLNDALVELTGTLAGLSFALQNSRLIGFAGLITGIAASFSMAASDYLSSKSEGKGETAARSALYTGVAYIITVILLVLPYLLGLHYLLSLGLTLAVALLIIAVFNYYISVAKDLAFHSRFLEMAGISLGVSAFTFLIGWVVRTVFGIDV